MKFKTLFSEREHVFCDPGSPTKVEYQLRVVDGQRELVETGKTSLYDYIQSHADSVDIHKILERCALLDDYSVLNRMPAAFMDVSEMPKNLADAFSAVQDAENFFDRMPLEVKQKYDNNFLNFLNDLGSDHFVDVVKGFVDSLNKDDVKEGAVDGES